MKENTHLFIYIYGIYKSPLEWADLRLFYLLTKCVIKVLVIPSFICNLFDAIFILLHIIIVIIIISYSYSWSHKLYTISVFIFLKIHSKVLREI